MKRKSLHSNKIRGIVFTISISVLIALWLTNPQETREDLKRIANTLQETYEDTAIDIQIRRGKETGLFGMSMDDPVGRYDCHITTISGFDHQYINRYDVNEHNEKFNIDVYSCLVDEIPRPHLNLNSYYVLANKQNGILAIQAKTRYYGEIYEEIVRKREEIINQLKEKYGGVCAALDHCPSLQCKFRDRYSERFLGPCVAL